MSGRNLIRWIVCWPIAIGAMWGTAALGGIIYFAMTAVLSLGSEQAILDRMWFVYAASGGCGGFAGTYLGLIILPRRSKSIILAMRITLSVVVACLTIGDVLAKDWVRLFQEVGFLIGIWTTSSAEKVSLV